MKAKKEPAKVRFYQPQPFPKTSQEAFDILSYNQDLSEIKDILFNFKQLVDIKKSVLTSHTLPDSKIPNNQAFIDNLETRINRLEAAVDKDEAYPSFYGDVCKVKEDLQVILGYYQSQIKQGQPIVKSYMRQAQSSASELTALASELASEQHPILDNKDSRMLTKYTINYCATDIMQEDVATIEYIVQKPYLLDHSDDPQFSYLK
ncbi:hypothetical protein Lste_2250 [Legionella steelei]|uniref:Uncharacterized protein n=1 Tax=Legionella steelei TaxID=947033 RepID=A0A0W0ZJE3_9GAMM|nr:hypothetical protein [Legionella steelei]KTD69092.1 hypothetical protein Lste_2250 [Legionella steelei]